ncbi:MAG: AI-2E family transporter [Candidatus Kerfeldbacteria bacterium]|nr:AI-2E family transporter [Candidatus Kerfeldbacteria bacterium]
MANSEHRSIVITTSSVLRMVLVLLVLWFLYLIRDVIIMVFIAFALSSAIAPWVDFLQRKRIPRAASTIGIAALFFGLLSLTVVLIVPALIEEVRMLTTKLPELYTSVAGRLFALDNAPTPADAVAALEKNLQGFTQGLLQLTSSIFGTLSSIFGGVASFLTVLVITFFMSIEESGPRKLIQSLAPPKFQPYLVQLIGKIQAKMGGWLRGQLLLSVIIAAVTYLGLTLLGVKFALVLALFAGFMEIIPFIGPVIGAIPAVFFAASQSSLLALLVVLLYVLVQQLENNLLVPKVMQRTVGLHPLVILLAVMVGVRIGGFLGVVLAVPVATIIDVFINDLFEDRRTRRGPPDVKMASM